MLKNCLILSFFIICILNNPQNIISAELTVLYTANSNGKLRICGCPEDPYGGLAERVTLIKKLRESDIPFLLVDAGNMTDIFGDYDKKASQVISLMNMMKYDAATVGFNEIYRGLASAEKLKNKAEFPILASTITNKYEKYELFKTYIITHCNGNNVGIIGLCDENSFIKIGNPDFKDFIFLPSLDTLKKILKEISGKTDFIIVLSEMSPEKNISLLKKFSKIDLIIECYTNKQYNPPIKEGKSFIVSPGKYGRFVGKIVMEKAKNTPLTIKNHEFIPVKNILPDKEAYKIIME